jgi:DNA-binding Lrp family transcriptional regulator
MDPLDFSIYRFLSPGGEARFWAGRRVIDPTIPVREIAERVGISENGVRTRLRGLAARGYLRGVAAMPNPSIFGMRVWAVELPVKGVGEVERIYADLALVEGVVFARDTLGEGERRLRVHFLCEGESVARRRAALLGRLSPGAGVPEFLPYQIPPSEAEPTPLDWRLISAVRRRPDASVADTAHEVGVSLKTAANRRRRLLDARAYWYTHSPECEEFPLALVRVEVREASTRDGVAGTVANETPSWMPVAGDGLGLEPDAAATVVAGLVPADAPIVLERIIQQLSGRPEVASVRRTFALGSRTYPIWYDDQLAQRVPSIAKSSLPRRKGGPGGRRTRPA